jgi:hypothetical protein
MRTWYELQHKKPDCACDSEDGVPAIEWHTMISLHSWDDPAARAIVLRDLRRDALAGEEFRMRKCTEEVLGE